MTIIGSILTVYRLVKALLAEKKKLEANAKAYLSEPHAKEFRLYLERMFLALEQGDANPNFVQLPRIVRWFCGGTKIDNYIGGFGQNVLKSQKLATNDPILHQDIAPRQDRTAGFRHGDHP